MREIPRTSAARCAWQDAACGPYERNADENWVSVPICHLSRFALFADELHAVYLPLVLRSP